MTLKQQTIGFIGAGNMAEAIIGGLIPAGVPAGNVVIADPNRERCAHLQQQFAVQVAADNQALIGQADVVVLAVKPQLMREVLTPLAVPLQQARPLLISVAAGISLALLKTWSGGVCPLVRVMPNTPALVRAGISGLFADGAVSDAQRQLADDIMRAVGEVVWVDSEALIDSVTAVSGSGPAYFFLMIEALQAAALTHGLNDEQARQLAQQTALGAAKLASASELSAAVLRERVTSPGGTTEAALASFQQSGFREAVNQAVDAAVRRSRELADMAKENQ